MFNVIADEVLHDTEQRYLTGSKQNNFIMKLLDFTKFENTKMREDLINQELENLLNDIEIPYEYLHGQKNIIKIASKAKTLKELVKKTENTTLFKSSNDLFNNFSRFEAKG